MGDGFLPNLTKMSSAKRGCRTGGRIEFNGARRRQRASALRSASERPWGRRGARREFAKGQAQPPLAQKWEIEISFVPRWPQVQRGTRAPQFRQTKAWRPAGGPVCTAGSSIPRCTVMGTGVRCPPKCGERVWDQRKAQGKGVRVNRRAKVLKTGGEKISEGCHLTWCAGCFQWPSGTAVTFSKAHGLKVPQRQRPRADLETATA